MSDLYTTYYNSPIGTLKLVAEHDALIECTYVKDDRIRIPTQAYHPILKETITQLDAYFKGQLYDFKIPLRLIGTPFRCRVWQQLRTVEYAKTASYGDIAKGIQQPKASRAVGQANHHNPFSIIIPCHRIIGSSGKLVGYGGGLWRKKWLLAHEKSSIIKSK